MKVRTELLLAAGAVYAEAGKYGDPVIGVSIDGVAVPAPANARRRAEAELATASGSHLDELMEKAGRAAEQAQHKLRSVGWVQRFLDRFRSTSVGQALSRTLSGHPEHVRDEVVAEVRFASGASACYPLEVSRIDATRRLQRISALAESAMTVNVIPLLDTTICCTTALTAGCIAALGKLRGDAALASAAVETAQKHAVLAVVALIPVAAMVAPGLTAALDVQDMRQTRRGEGVVRFTLSGSRDSQS